MVWDGIYVHQLRLYIYICCRVSGWLAHLWNHGIYSYSYAHVGIQEPTDDNLPVAPTTHPCWLVVTYGVLYYPLVISELTIFFNFFNGALTVDFFTALPVIFHSFLQMSTRGYSPIIGEYSFWWNPRYGCHGWSCTNKNHGVFVGRYNTNSMWHFFGKLLNFFLLQIVENDHGELSE